MNSKRKRTILLSVFTVFAVVGLVLFVGTIALASNITDLDFMTFLPIVLHQSTYVEANTEVWTLRNYVSVDDSTGAITSSGFGYGWECGHEPCPAIPTDSISGFAPITREVSIESLNIMVLARDNSVLDSLSLTFEVRNTTGEVQHTVSSSAIDLLTAPMREWVPISLSSVQENLIVSPGEYLAIHAEPAGVADPEGWYDIRPLFEAIVRDTG